MNYTKQVFNTLQNEECAPKPNINARTHLSMSIAVLGAIWFCPLVHAETIEEILLKSNKSNSTQSGTSTTSTTATQTTKTIEDAKEQMKKAALEAQQKAEALKNSVKNIPPVDVESLKKSLDTTRASYEENKKSLTEFASKRAAFVEVIEKDKQQLETVKGFIVKPPPEYISTYNYTYRNPLFKTKAAYEAERDILQKKIGENIKVLNDKFPEAKLKEVEAKAEVVLQKAQEEAQVIRDQNMTGNTQSTRRVKK